MRECSADPDLSLSIPTGCGVLGAGGVLTAARGDVERLRQDLATVVEALPPDPRGGSVELRAGRFTAKGNTLACDVVLTRQRGGRPLPGIVQFSVAGATARGAESTSTHKLNSVLIGALEIVRGSLPLPEGFRTRQATVQVLESATGRSLGMRVMLVKQSARALVTPARAAPALPEVVHQMVVEGALPMRAEAPACGDLAIGGRPPGFRAAHAARVSTESDSSFDA